jgi:hypothetical protein
MPEERKRKQGKKNRKFGRNRYGDPKCGPANRRYVDQNHRFRNKLANVQRCNGEDAARSYQAKHAGQKYEGKSLAKVKGKS